MRHIENNLEGVSRRDGEAGGGKNDREGTPTRKAGESELKAPLRSLFQKIKSRGGGKGLARQKKRWGLFG